MSRSAKNRPFKYGEKDRRIFIAEDSEVTLRSENNATGDPIFLGRAKSGTQTSELKWQIKFLTYDANGGILSVTWPENDEGSNSTEYEFAWDDRNTLIFG